MSSLELVRLVRPTTAKLIELAAYDREAFGETGLRSYDLGVVARAGALYVGMVGDTIAASCQLMRMMDEPGMFWVLGFYVRPDYQGQGVGRDLLRAVSKEVHRYGGCGLMLTADPDGATALNLYLRFGFKVVEQVADFYGPGEDRFVLRWDATDASGAAEKRR